VRTSRANELAGAAREPRRPRRVSRHRALARSMYLTLCAARSCTGQSRSRSSRWVSGASAPSSFMGGRFARAHTPPAHGSARGAWSRCLTYVAAGRALAGGACGATLYEALQLNVGVSPQQLFELRARSHSIVPHGPPRKSRSTGAVLLSLLDGRRARAGVVAPRAVFGEPRLAMTGDGAWPGGPPNCRPTRLRANVG
jgi:hypothetical protein